MKRSNAEKAALLAQRIVDQVERGAGKGLAQALSFGVARVKETLSTAAPRERTAHGYRATTRATPDAPPRKVSGVLRSRVSYRMLTACSGLLVVSTKYARPLEKSKKHPHKYVEPTLRRWRKEMVRIVGRAVRVEFGK